MLLGRKRFNTRRARVRFDISACQERSPTRAILFFSCKLGQWRRAESNIETSAVREACSKG